MRGLPGRRPAVRGSAAFRLAIRKALDELLERVVTSLLPRLKSEGGERFARILRAPRRHLEDFATRLRASLQGHGRPTPGPRRR
ncbi:hypothetical protein TH66_19430 [Carbonactinospora thermoautotrophica]|uniref:Uncharacterized protein n=1 Tax=Carbonactinospora thermoautotrophica TaxID=1469144 RepID=A0A132NJE5_9ACTN|nr:hypothetical protein TH66_19430 [Carbonactinospora thermoautotrophica]KWX10259.1 hypothetical protein TR74_04685 [Carbonactinospora thermoautotrophica]